MNPLGERPPIGDLKKVSALLTEIAQIAFSIQTQADVAIETSSGREENLLLGIQKLARQAGLFADLCQSAVRGRPFGSDVPLEWLCPDAVDWPSPPSGSAAACLCVRGQNKGNQD
jgi:hypothetical protein